MFQVQSVPGGDQRSYSCQTLLYLLLGASLIRTAHEQSEQRSEQKASAQEAAVMMVMMAMAAMTAKDHVSKSQGSKQTQHFVFLQFSRFVCTGHSVRV